MVLKVVTVKAFWDAEASVWVATSDNLPGLVTEAETTEQLTVKLKAMIPELIDLNRIKFQDK
jgi:predicted RNase H-like HicB family nuclease